MGQLALIDHDTVSESNLNRQLVALHSTIGQPKAAVMAARLRDINPDIKVTEYSLFYMPETAMYMTARACFRAVMRTAPARQE